MPIFSSKIWQWALWPLSQLYAAIIGLRNLAYDRQWFKIYRVPATVISIGNISIGGTGKTPATIFLAKNLAERGYTVGILSRGYGRTSKGPLLVCDGERVLCSVADAGDEPYLMALHLAGVPILVDADRVRGARLLLQQFPLDIILLDDGFQHRRLHRDADLVLFDPGQLRKNRHLLPAGPLREGMSALRRAKLIWLVTAGDAAVAEVQQLLRNPSPARIDVARVVSERLWLPGENRDLPLSYINKRKILAVAGIGQPGKFRRALESTGAEIVRFIVHPDHTAYSEARVQRLVRLFSASGAEILVTTMKDWVKLRGHDRLNELPVLVLQIAFSATPKALDYIIEQSGARNRLAAGQ